MNATQDMTVMEAYSIALADYLRGIDEGTIDILDWSKKPNLSDFIEEAMNGKL